MHSEQSLSTSEKRQALIVPVFKQLRAISTYRSSKNIDVDVNTKSCGNYLQDRLCEEKCSFSKKFFHLVQSFDSWDLLCTLS